VTSTLRGGELLGSLIAQRTLGHFNVSLKQYDDAAELPWHVHQEPYVTFVVDGRYRERLPSGWRDCTPRSLVVHPAGERHADVFEVGRSRCLDIRFDADWLRALGGRGDAFGRPDVVRAPAAAAIGARAVRELRRDDPFSPMVFEGLMLELFGELARHGERDAAPSWLGEVRSVIAKRFTEKLALKELAAMVDVHPVHLARAFRRHYGCTVGDVVRDLRVEHAKRRIAAGATLSDVALEAGFADQSHFARTFRRISGVTPATFRRSPRD
jgi:AraC family transcriptional regulator